MSCFRLGIFLSVGPRSPKFCYRAIQSICPQISTVTCVPSRIPHLAGYSPESRAGEQSIHWADVTVAPSEAFATDLRRWTGLPIRAIHHGFDNTAFFRDSSPLSAEVEEKLQTAEGSFKLLLVSHYNYYRNFETLIRALPLLRDRLAGRSVKLLLTCSLAPGDDLGAYHPQAAAKLVEKLGVSGMVVELGVVPYHQLHRLYPRADVYVTPAYTETFAHPLVEAMASGLPVAASDLEVHREICGEAAVYFPRFSPEALTGCVGEIAESPGKARTMAAEGLTRSRQFSWATHVEQILELSQSLIDAKVAKASNSQERRALKNKRADSA